MSTRTDDKATERLVKKVLSNPDFFPPEFKAYIPRLVEANASFKLDPVQLPTVEPWHVVDNAGQPAFLNGWVNFGGGDTTAAYYRDPFGTVHLKGTLKSGTIGTTIFTLPPGYRPQEISFFPAWSNAAFGGVIIQTTGAVVANNGSNVSFSLDGITFRAYA